MENKKTCILVITSISQEVYKHYINSHWKDLLDNKHSISIYFLLDNNKELINFFIDNNLIKYCIINETAEGHSTFIPGILSKTIFSFEKLVGKYDVYLRTNLSSYIKIDKLVEYIQSNNIIYSGLWCWNNALRENLLLNKRIGLDKSIKTLEELDKYPGNTFFSGSCFFLNKDEVKQIIENKDIIRYDIVDDVSIGLLLKDYTHIISNHLVITNDSDIDASVKAIQSIDGFWIRLQYLTVEKAKLLYNKLRNN